MALRRFIIDTDTGSDDVWAIVEGLRAAEIVSVEAITTVCGNLPLDLCTKNALIAEEQAGNSCPPVFRGMETPIMSNETFYAPYCHGEDGLGNMNLPHPDRQPEDKPAVDALIDIVMANPGEIEIVTCGPLSNLAMAVLREPDFAKNVKKAWILGGSAGRPGNMTKAGEYNVYCDADAAQIVLNSGMNSAWVAWDAYGPEGEITPKEVEILQNSGDRAARFCVRCAETLRQYYHNQDGRSTFGVVDTGVMTAALYPEVISEAFPCFGSIELESGEERGRFYIDTEKTPNCTVISRLDASLFKKKLFSLLMQESVNGKGDNL